MKEIFEQLDQLAGSMRSLLKAMSNMIDETPTTQHVVKRKEDPADAERQIQELSYVLHSRCQSQSDCKANCQKCMATAMYEAGYRKI